MEGEYVPDVDANLLATVKDELHRKEEQQKLHYFYQKELQNMARELPAKYQQRLPYDLLSGLANAVLDGTVFEITRSMNEVQQLEEKNLFSQRQQLINEHKNARQELQKKAREALQECQSKPHNLILVQTQNEKEWEAMEKKYDEELKRKDMKIILELDQKVLDQQVTLEKAGVPGFFVTNNPLEIKLQMYLLDFVRRCSTIEMPS